ncbi:nucleoside deaminase [Membranihabitans maritimus]|uniref:nucleoside deaminase n=1 Tax=Membranihabitans maritimus TaxID=2904244 RepID=UPI001F32634C|nr:nucleoside deaminase [Membranihabitans maritimus]
MKDTDPIFMQQALNLAKQALERDEIPIGSVITYNDKIIARSFNQVEMLTDPTAHAEMISITSAINAVGGKYLEDCTLYVTLEPCFMCAGAIHWSRLSRVVFGAPDPKKGFTNYQPSVLLDKVEILSGVMSTECEQLIKRFFLKKRR